MTRDKFQVESGQLNGRGLSFDVETIIASQTTPEDRRTRFLEIVEAVYLQGRASILPSWDDRFDLDCTVAALRALAVIVGPSATGDRHRRAADIIARLLQEQRG